MILLFSANESGGILQFVIQVLRVLKEKKYDVQCFIPKNADVTISQKDEESITWYTKVKTFSRYNSNVRDISEKMKSCKPDFIWYFDNTILTSHILRNLQKGIKQAIIMHDAGNYHPSFHGSFLGKIKIWFEAFCSKKAEDAANAIIVLSPSSLKQYSKYNPKNRDKVYLLPLGAHIPKCAPSCPNEIQHLKTGFNLFFGRLDKYKGINTLIDVYCDSATKTPLVIAGNGIIEANVLKKANSDSRIYVLKRYIRDEEMIYLFKNSRISVLPYIEATQSGILPISYFYGKPVITSNVEGLVQFVKDGVTGYICSSKEEYLKAIEKMDDDFIRCNLGRGAKDYYDKNLNWDKNISDMFTYLQI